MAGPPHLGVEEVAQVLRRRADARLFEYSAGSRSRLLAVVTHMASNPLQDLSMALSIVSVYVDSDSIDSDSIGVDALLHAV